MPLHPSLVVQGALPQPADTLANVPQSTTDNVLVTATPGKKVVVLSGFFMCGGTATTLVFGSKLGAGATTAVTPTIANGANGGAELGYNPLGHFETLVGEGLVCTTGAGSTTGIKLQYVQV